MRLFLWFSNTVRRILTRKQQLFTRFCGLWTKTLIRQCFDCTGSSPVIRSYRFNGFKSGKCTGDTHGRRVSYSTTFERFCGQSALFIQYFVVTFYQCTGMFLVHFGILIHFWNFYPFMDFGFWLSQQVWKRQNVVFIKLQKCNFF